MPRYLQFDSLRCGWGEAADRVFSADENSMALLIEEGGGNPDLMRRLPPPQWYAADDGLATVLALVVE